MGGTRSRKRRRSNGASGSRKKQKRSSGHKRAKRSSTRKAGVKKSLSIGKGFPDKIRTPFVYYQGLTNLASAGTAPLVRHEFRASSLFDPDLTGAGLQPQHFDTWKALYNHYLVHAVKVVANFKNTSDVDMRVGIAIDAENSAWSGRNAFNMVTARRCKSKFLKARPAGQDYPRVSVTFYVYLKEFFGVKDMADNDELSALVTADPAENAYLSILSGSADSSTLTHSVDFDATITYYSEMFEPKTVFTA